MSVLVLTLIYAPRDISEDPRHDGPRPEDPRHEDLRHEDPRPEDQRKTCDTTTRDAETQDTKTRDTKIRDPMTRTRSLLSALSWITRSGNERVSLPKHFYTTTGAIQQTPARMFISKQVELMQKLP